MLSRSGLSRLPAALLLVVLVLFPVAAVAVNPDEILSDPALETRAREISSEVRCMVCQNQSIDDSDASLAKDLRVLIRERLVEGDSNQQVLDFLVDRYGEFVLLRPRLSWRNLMLWAAPLLVLLVGGLLAWHTIGSRQRDDEVPQSGKPLSGGEEEALKNILEDRD